VLLHAAEVVEAQSEIAEGSVGRLVLGESADQDEDVAEQFRRIGLPREARILRR